MLMTDRNEGSAIWFAIVVGLVFLVTILGAALILGPMRSNEGRTLRLDRPSVPSEPKLPEPSKLPRQVV